MNFVLSPWVREEAKGSSTYLSGNVLPWEGQLPSKFLEHLGKKNLLNHSEGWSKIEIYP